MKIKVNIFPNVLCLTILIFILGLVSSKPTFVADYQLSGSVKDNTGNAMSGAIIDIYHVGTNTDLVYTTTANDGTGGYVFNNLPNGTYDIKVNPPTMEHKGKQQIPTSQYTLQHHQVNSQQVKDL